jgi:hypothetical protein
VSSDHHIAHSSVSVKRLERVTGPREPAIHQLATSLLHARRHTHTHTRLYITKTQGSIHPACTLLGVQQSLSASIDELDKRPELPLFTHRHGRRELRVQQDPFACPSCRLATRKRMLSIRCSGFGNCLGRVLVFTHQLHVDDNKYAVVSRCSIELGCFFHRNTQNLHQTSFESTISSCTCTDALQQAPATTRHPWCERLVVCGEQVCSSCEAARRHPPS